MTSGRGANLLPLNPEAAELMEDLNEPFKGALKLLVLSWSYLSMGGNSS